MNYVKLVYWSKVSNKSSLNLDKVNYKPISIFPNIAKVNSSYSNFDKILNGVPFLFNIFNCGLSYVADLDLASYNNDNTSSILSPELAAVIRRHKNATFKTSECFHINCLNANIDKWNLMTNSKLREQIHYRENSIRTAKSIIRILVLNVDRWFKFEYHVNQLWEKVMGKKKGTYSFYNFPFFILYLGMDVALWKNGATIKRIDKRVLKLIYTDTRILSFEKLLVKHKSVSIHQKSVLPQKLSKSKVIFFLN